MLSFGKHKLPMLSKNMPPGTVLERDIGEDLLLIIRPLWCGAGSRLAPIEKIIHPQGKSAKEAGVSDTPAD